MVAPNIGIVGAGVVGTAASAFFGSASVVYDTKPGAPHDRDAINACDAAFVCVPTPMSDDGTCDVSIVESVVEWIESPLIIIRSTVSPGTTDRLMARYGKHIVFQPEYLGETPGHAFTNVAARTFLVLGGKPEDTSRAADIYKGFYNSTARFYFCDAKTAELAKYMENSFYAVKVTFVNEFYSIAQAHGVNFDELREMWLADTRISRDHTFVFSGNRGFAGKCLPKDTNAIVASSRKRGYDAPLMRATLQVNELFRAMNDD